MQVFPYHKQWPVCKKKKNMRKKVQENKVFSKEKFTIFFLLCRMGKNNITNLLMKGKGY